MVSKSSQYRFKKNKFYGSILYLTTSENRFKNLIDLRTDKYSYGRVNFENIVIIPKRAHIKHHTGSKMVLNIDFVVDAFEDMKTYFKQASNNIHKDSILYNISATRGWADVDISYNNYLEKISNIYVQTNRNKIITFDNFLQSFKNFLLTTASINYPVTKSGFVLSNLYNPLSTGLFLEIESKANHDDNNAKIQKYFKDPNYLFYLRAAQRHGFLIDINAPWRLVANIRSKKMLTYMSEYEINSDTLFQKCFNKTCVKDLETLKHIFLSTYHSLTEKKYFETHIQTDSKNKTKIKLTKREKYDIDKLSNGYSIDYWIDLYVQIRNKELGTPLDESKIKQFSTDVKYMKKTLDLESVLIYIDNSLRNRH